jgi:hypothetical protein
LAGLQTRQARQHIADRAMLVWLVSGRYHLDWTESRREDNETTAMLRDAIVRAIDHALLGFIREVIAFAPQYPQELLEDRVVL